MPTILSPIFKWCSLRPAMLHYRSAVLDCTKSTLIREINTRSETSTPFQSLPCSAFKVIAVRTSNLVEQICGPEWTTALTWMYEALCLPSHYATWCVYTRKMCHLKLLIDFSNANDLANFAYSLFFYELFLLFCLDVWLFQYFRLFYLIHHEEWVRVFVQKKCKLSYTLLKSHFLEFMICLCTFFIIHTINKKSLKHPLQLIQCTHIYKTYFHSLPNQNFLMVIIISRAD